MSTASKPATAAFALVTGASSGIGAQNERVSRPLEAQEDRAPCLRPCLLVALMLAPGSAASAREPSVHQVPSEATPQTDEMYRSAVTGI